METRCEFSKGRNDEFDSKAFHHLRCNASVVNGELDSSRLHQDLIQNSILQYTTCKFTIFEAFCNN
jgi:hypothetical protein